MKTVYRGFKFLILLCSLSALALLMLYSVAGRYALNQLPQYHEALAEEISTALALPLSIESMEGSWAGFDPIIRLRDVTLNGAENASVAQMRIRFSFLRSLWSQTLSVQSIEIERLNIALQQDAQADWYFGDTNLLRLLQRQAEPDATEGAGELAKWVSIDAATAIISNSYIRLTDRHGVSRNWRAPVIHLDYQGDRIAASGQVLEPETDHAMLSFALKGDGLLWREHLFTSAYVELNSGTLLNELLETYQWQGLSTRAIDANGRIWLNLEDATLRQAAGELQIKAMHWVNRDEAQVPLQDMTLGFSYDMTDAQAVHGAGVQHTLALNGLRIGAPKDECIDSNLILRKNNHTLNLVMDQLDVACALGLVDVLGGLEGELKERIDISQPSGRLHNIFLALPAADKNTEADPQDFTFAAELSNVSLLPYQSTPGGSGIDGFVEAVPGAGAVTFASDQFSLHFPRLYHKPFLMRRAEGQVKWQEKSDETVIASTGLRLHTSQDSLVYGDFIARLNPDTEEDVLALMIGVQDVPFPEVLDYVPYTVSPGIYEWLGESMLGGYVHGGIYVGYGSIESETPEHSFTSSLQMHTRDGELKFQPDWPALTALDVTVDLQNDALWVSGVKNADLLGHPVKNLNVVLDPDYARTHNKGISVLQVDLATQVINQQLHYWLAESPVSENTKALADQLVLEGTVDGKVNLLIPMEGNDPVLYDIQLRLEKERLHHLPSRLTLDQLSGEIGLSSQKGLHARHVGATLFGQRAKIDIESVPGSDRQPAQTRIALNSHLRVQRWLEHYDLPLVRGVSGGFDFLAVLSLDTGQDPHLLVSSNTLGLSREWPEPLAKRANASEHLAVDLLLKADQTRVAANWEMTSGIPVQSNLRFAAGRLEQGELLIGKAQSRQETEPGLFLRTDVAHLELAPWIEFWRSDQAFLQYSMPEQTSSTESKPGEPLLKRIEIHAQQLNAYDTLLQDVSVLLTPKDADWDIALSGPSIAGRVVLAKPDQPLSLDFDHVHLPHHAAETPPDKAALIQQRRASNPQNFPEMSVYIGDFKSGNTEYGAWRSQVVPVENGVLFKAIEGQFHGARIKGQLEWKKLDNELHSSMALLDIQGADLARLLAAFDVHDLITSEKFSSELALHWGDMPSQFELAKLSGNVSLDMQQGVLKTDDTKTGILRVFGVLNPETIFRRLQLDFSDLVSSGVAYDSLTVRATMDQGQLNLKEALKIKGPSSSYDISGKADMVNRQFDLSMVVTLPITQNVPLAALMLGAPVVGGAVWIVDKLLGEPLSSLTTAGYTIKGSWSDPVVELQQVVNAGERKVLKRK